MSFKWIPTWFFPLMFLLLVNSRCLLHRSRSKPIDKSSLPLLDANSPYVNETMWAWSIFSRCLPELAVSLKLLNKVIIARLTNHISSPSTYLLLVPAWSTSKFKSRKLFNREIGETSQGKLNFIRELAVCIMTFSDGEYRLWSHFRIFLSVRYFSLSLKIYI